MNRFLPAVSKTWVRWALIVGGVLIAIAGCRDQSPQPTAPAAQRGACPSGTTPTNTGDCVATAPTAGKPHPAGRLSATLATSSGSLTTFDVPDASWTGLTTLIDISSIANFTRVTSVTDGNLIV